MTPSSILADYELVDIRRRAEEWRASGWHPPVCPERAPATPG